MDERVSGAWVGSASFIVKLIWRDTYIVLLSVGFSYILLLQ